MHWTILLRGFHVLHIVFKCISNFNKLWESALCQTPSHWILLISCTSPFSSALVIREQVRAWESTKGLDTRGAEAGRHASPLRHPSGLSWSLLEMRGYCLSSLQLSLKLQTAGTGSGHLCSHLLELCNGQKTSINSCSSSRLRTFLWEQQQKSPWPSRRKSGLTQSTVHGRECASIPFPPVSPFCPF